MVLPTVHQPSTIVLLTVFHPSRNSLPPYYTFYFLNSPEIKLAPIFVHLCMCMCALY